MVEKATNSPRLLHEFFERTARRFPDQVAVDVPPGFGRPARSTLTYAQLHAQAESLAARLRALREVVQPDGVVGIMLPRSSSDLYVAQLAVLRSGAAFTCLDPVFPDAHIASVLADGDVGVLISDAQGMKRAAMAGCAVPHQIDISKVLQNEASPARADITSPTSFPVPSAAPTLPENLAYVIYTSGTTGVPKGVMIEHRSVVNLVASDLAEFGLTPQDRVGQGSSAAYDSSIEEIWLAFASGATLVLMDDDTSRLGPDLMAWMRRERISAFCPPPTLLRTTNCTDPGRELPDLRLLYVGGEALPDDLVERWAPGRRLVNGYGPTECTVTVVRGDVVPGKQVTIGKPVPGHTAWVMNSDLRPVPDGADGELCISGIGLARGYRGKDELTREKFPVHPSLGRMYRTGDLARVTDSGELLYLGRIDAQVKLRGYRVELEAVEAHLVKCAGVREAACRLEGSGADASLAAHLVPIDISAPPDFVLVRQALRGVLPPYMVPTRMGLIEALPRSVGGKVDRKQLPDLGPMAVAVVAEDRRDVLAPRSSAEQIVVAAFASVLKHSTPISTRDDFFVDLGGDSLSAVGVICVLREHPATAGLTTRDLYEARTAAALAARTSASGMIDRARPAQRPRRTARDGSKPFPNLVTAAQSVWIGFGLVMASAAAYAVAFEVVPALLDRFGIIGVLAFEIPAVIVGVALYTLLSLLLTAALKWTLIGRYTARRTPVWSTFYLRHWIVASAARTVPWSMLAETVAYSAALRLLGAKVGRRVHIHRGVNLQHGGWDLLTIGDGVTLSREAHLGLVELDDGCLCIGPVTIEDDATLEIRAAVSANTVVRAGGCLTALSWLQGGDSIGPGERWDGVPALPSGRAPQAPTPTRPGRLSPTLHAALQIGTSLVLRASGSMPLLVAAYAASVALGLSAADVASWLLAPTWNEQSLLISGAIVVAWAPCWLALKAVSLRSIGRIKPGVIDQGSIESIKVWFKTSELEAAGLWLSGTLFWPRWLRLAGMRIGRGCEISTIIDVVPEHLRIGAASFFADGIYLGGPRVYRGTITIAETSLGSGTFLGNHVVIPAGAALPDDLFIGVCTVADPAEVRPGSSWFGHPALELPRRDVVQADRRLTHAPGVARFCNRLFWESLRFGLGVFPLAMGGLWFWGLSLAGENSVAAAIVVAPIVTLLVLVVDCAAVVALKWLLLGRARAGQHPLWSCWCSRWDFLYVAWQFYASPALVALEGTLFLGVFLRAMGVRIGERVVLGPGMGQLADPDMVIIEDDATVNANYQAHSFEDRVLKLAPVVVRRGATVGESAVVFYGADIGAHSWVTTNSVVMKNERLSAGLAYGGCPVATMDEAAPAGPSSLADANARPQVESRAFAASGRLAFLDLARGLALMGMIYMHFVPAESEATAGRLANIWTSVSDFLAGKSAALFCVLAGVAWEIQSRRNGQIGTSGVSGVSGWYFIRRAAALAAVGIALHVLCWPTEVLVPLAVMMLVTVWLRSLGTGAVACAAVVTLLFTPFVPVLFGEYLSNDWNADGGHLADTTVGWATLRALLIDGNYPLVPWLAYPLVGLLLAKQLRTPGAVRRWFLWSVLAYIVGQAYVLLAREAVDDSGLAAAVWTSVCAATAEPMSLWFAATSGSCAVAIISGLGWLMSKRTSPRWMEMLERFGQASLTHYLLHICVLYQAMKWVIGNDEWSAATGVMAFAGYVLVAVPLTAVWFTRFARGPVEALWARAAGRT